MLYKLSQFHVVAEDSEDKPTFETKPLEKEGDESVCAVCDKNPAMQDLDVCQDCSEANEADSSEEELSEESLEEADASEPESVEEGLSDLGLDEPESAMNDNEEDEELDLAKPRAKRPMPLHHQVITPHVERAVELLGTRKTLLDELQSVDLELAGIHELLGRNDGLSHPMLSKNKLAKQWFESIGKRRARKKEADIVATLNKVASVLQKEGDQEGVSLTDSILKVFAKKNSGTTEKNDKDSDGLYGVKTIKKTNREYPETPSASFAAPSLSTRYCPDHHGVMIKRIGEGSYQCELDGKVYNWNEGFKDYYGNVFPANQIKGIDFPALVERPFETRDMATKKNLK